MAVLILPLAHLVRAAALAILVAAQASAQGFTGVARLDPEASRVEDSRGGLSVTLSLSRAVPWRVLTLDAPRRLVIEFREVDWAGSTPEALLEAGRATGLSLGRSRSGWSRLTADLGEPLAVEEAGMAVDPADGSATLRIALAPTDAAGFAAVAAPAEAAPEVALDRTAPDDRFVVAIDPGHGGLDPGAERGGLREAHLMLALAREVREACLRAGIDPVLTRDGDAFVPLSDRISIARAVGADVLISLHADALEEDEASGASVYTLSADASDRASARMVERHEGGDLLAGLDLTGQDDTVAMALMDLARRDTAPRSRRLAATIAAELGQAGAAVNGHALRQAPLAVLNAADFPSVLIEAGFLSDSGDRARLSTPEGRAPIVAGLVAALLAWRADEAARAPLLRR